MRRTLIMLGAGALAGAGLVLVGFFVEPHIALWLMFAWLNW